MASPTPSPAPALKYDTRSAIAAGLCLTSLFMDGMGWLLAIAGIVLLRRAAFPPKVKWIFAAIALAPKILFLGVRMLNASPALSFTIEPRTLATSSSLWSLCVFLAAVGAILIHVPRSMRGAPEGPVQPTESGTPVLKLLGVLTIAGAVLLLSGLTDDFQRIDDAGNGRWALKHAARGAVATFTPYEVASINGTETWNRRSIDRSVRVTLTNGRTYSASTTSNETLPNVRTFATTAALRPGTVRIRDHSGRVWTNGESGFTLKDILGTYEYANPRASDRSTLEFWFDKGRLAGKEITVDGPTRHARMLRDIKLTDTGEVEFSESSYLEASKPSQSTIALSFAWSPQRETGRFTKDGLQVGVKKYRKQ